MKVKVLKLRVELSEQCVRGFHENGASTNLEIRDRIVEHLEELFGEMSDAGEETDETDEDSDT